MDMLQRINAMLHIGDKTTASPASGASSSSGLSDGVYVIEAADGSSGAALREQKWTITSVAGENSVYYIKAADGGWNPTGGVKWKITQAGGQPPLDKWTCGTEQKASEGNIWFQAPFDCEWVDIHFVLNASSDAQQNMRMKRPTPAGQSSANQHYDLPSFIQLGASTSAQCWFSYFAANAQHRLPEAEGETVKVVFGSVPPVPPTTDLFGKYVKVYDASNAAQAQADMTEAYAHYDVSNPKAQLGLQRFTFLFKPGEYHVSSRIGFYTAVAGLGLNPDDVTIIGDLTADVGMVYGDENNVTQNFWRSLENLRIQPTLNYNGVRYAQWAVSQAAPMRRVHVLGDLHIDPSNHAPGYASGGYIADCVIDGTTLSGSQQQWFTRDTVLAAKLPQPNNPGWIGGNWNMVFCNVVNAPASNFAPGRVPGDARCFTSLNASTAGLRRMPVWSEKPYLFYDAADNNYYVWVPTCERNSKAAGVRWPNTAGRRLLVAADNNTSDFFIAREGEATARQMNEALRAGKHLLFTPGMYPLEEPLLVTREDTVVFGLGFPVLKPSNGDSALKVDADVGGVRIAGLTFDAGVNSKSLLVIGPNGACNAPHANKPCMAQDVFFRVGGTEQGNCDCCLEVNSQDAVLDHVWAWRADHYNDGRHVQWDENRCATGVRINGSRVDACGMFVEHFREQEFEWNGEDGLLIFLQNEMPYDVPKDSDWDRRGGYPAFKVAHGLQHHQAWALGCYCYFIRPNTQSPEDPKKGLPSGVIVDHAFEVPDTDDVELRNILTVSLDRGVIRHLVNQYGNSVTPDQHAEPNKARRYCNAQLMY